MNRGRRREVPVLDVAAALGLLQEVLGRVDALLYATERHFERFGWSCRDDVDETENPVGHLAHLIAGAREAALSALSLGATIGTELTKRRTEA